MTGSYSSSLRVHGQNKGEGHELNIKIGPKIQSSSGPITFNNCCRDINSFWATAHIPEPPAPDVISSVDFVDSKLMKEHEFASQLN